MDEDRDEPGTVALDWAFRGFMVLGVAAVAFLAWDAFSGGQATEQALRLVAKFRAGTVTKLERGTDADPG